MYIPPASGFREIKNLLLDSKVIREDGRFSLLARYLGISRQLKAGEYLFVPGISPIQILRDLAAGKTFLRALTIPEGSTIFQVADIMAEQGWADRQVFLDLVQSAIFLRSLGLDLPSLEGYLFPETYRFPKGEDIEAIVQTLVARTKLVIAEECKNQVLPQFTLDCSFDRRVSADAASEPENTQGKQGLGVREILTLASIVEKETGLAEERPLVAGVFLSRLSGNMKLQADPTVVYGLKKFGIPLSKKDLKSDGPYNTYTNRGLPPGPICNPSRAAISAVVNPVQRYYYFVAQGDGSHYFSTSLQEHNKAVRRLRRHEGSLGR